MTDNDYTIPPVALVDSDVSCTRCGYSLRGLAINGKCPECGWSIDASLRGGLLRYAGPEYLASLTSGALIIVITNIASLILTLLAVVLVFAFMLMPGLTGASMPGAPGGPAPAMPALGWLESGSTILAAIFAIASLVGYWQFTTPDPATEQSEQPRAARRIVRIAVGASIAIQLGLVVAALLGQSAVPTNPANPMAVATAIQITSGALNVAAVVASAVHFFAMMLYVRWLALRLPDPDMVQQTRMYIWLLPLLYTVGMACIGLGPLVALVLYVIMIWRLRKSLILAHAQSLALATN